MDRARNWVLDVVVLATLHFLTWTVTPQVVTLFFLYLFTLTIFCCIYGIFHYFINDVCTIINELFLKGLYQEMSPLVGMMGLLILGPMLLRTETIILGGLRLTSSESPMGAHSQTSKRELTSSLKYRVQDTENVLLGNMM